MISTIPQISCLRMIANTPAMTSITASIHSNMSMAVSAQVRPVRNRAERVITVTFRAWGGVAGSAAGHRRVTPYPWTS
jgi:hypothetical protein